VLAFETRKKKATEHYLVIPRRHISSIKDVDISSKKGKELLNHMLRVGKSIMKRHGGEKASFHFHIPPCNSINHLHMHCIKPPFTRLLWKWQFSNNGITSLDIETVLDGTVEEVRLRSLFRITFYLFLLVTALMLTIIYYNKNHLFF
jgi:hypothetical protein